MCLSVFWGILKFALWSCKSWMTYFHDHVTILPPPSPPRYWHGEPCRFIGSEWIWAKFEQENIRNVCMRETKNSWNHMGLFRKIWTYIYIYECSCISIITCWRERYCIHYSFYFVFRYKIYQHLGSQAIIYIIQPTPNEAHPKLSITIWQCRYIYIYHIS